MNSLSKDNYCVIMAGGVGSRFWPWSRNDRPKQFLDIIESGRTMIQETFDRFDPFIPEENIYVMTGKQFEAQMLRELPALHLVRSLLSLSDEIPLLPLPMLLTRSPALIPMR